MIIRKHAIDVMGRKGLYKGPSALRILSLNGGKGRSNIDRLLDIDSSVDVKVHVDAKSLDSLISGEGQQGHQGIDPFDMAAHVRDVAFSGEGVLVFSDDYRFEGGSNGPRDRSATIAMSHNPSNYANLCTVPLKQRLFGQRYSGRGSFSQEEVMANNMHADRVLRASMGLMRDHADSSRTALGYRWNRPMKNSGQNIVSFSRAIKAAQQMMLSNMAYWKRVVPRLPHGDMRKRFEGHRDAHVDLEVLSDLPLDVMDYIRIVRPHNKWQGWHVRTPSMRGERLASGRMLTHQVTLREAPVYHEQGSNRVKGALDYNTALSNIWCIRADDRGAPSEKAFREGRGRRSEDCYFTTATIAAAHVVRRKFKQGSSSYEQGFRMHDLPLVFPRKPMMDIWHALNESMMVTYTPKGKAQLRLLNDTEKDRQIGLQLMTCDYDTLFTTNLRDLNKQDVRALVQYRP